MIINWANVQNTSNELLADGVCNLIASQYKHISEIEYNKKGNYLILHKDQAHYIGEAKDIRIRLNQQFNSKTSTFFKTYSNLFKNSNTIKELDITDFSIKYMQTHIGRKEIEEFGIVNLETTLNKFQINKRIKFNISSQNEIWKLIQDKTGNLIAEAENEILNYQYNEWSFIDDYYKSGVYIIKDKGKNIIYIGESSNMSERHETHGSKTYFSALRRNIARTVFKYELKEISGKKKYLSKVEDSNVSDFLKQCTIAFYPVSFGRYELEEYLIDKYKPRFNRKGINF